jgi:putative DNA primase/helicase
MHVFNFEDTERFLNKLDDGGKFTFLTFSDKKDIPIRVQEFHGTFAEHMNNMQLLNKVGSGIFVAVNETDGKGRKNENIVRVRAHFIDSDNEPIEDVCKRFSLKPHMIVETSAGKGHAYYLVSDTALDEFSKIQSMLIQALGTDPAVKDLPRVMRLPGFNHMKGEARLVRLVHIENDLRPYTKAEILSALPPVADPVVSAPQPKVVSPMVPLADGERTETLTSLCGKLLAYGTSDEEALQWLTLWNNNNIEPLPEKKIWDTLQSLRKSDHRNHPERYGRELEYTDAGNSKKLVCTFGDDIRYCHDRSEWMSWNGQRWLSDNDGEIYRKAQIVAKKIYNDASKSATIGDVDKIARWAKQSLSKSGLGNMIALAQNDLDVSTTSSRLDQNDWLLNLANGTLDLKNIDHRAPSRDDLITKMANVSYLPGVGCPTWLTFLDQIFNGDQELISWVQKVVGYSLTGDISEQCAFFLIGDGSNGKSTFLNTLKKILGDYAAQAHPNTFLVNRYNSAGAARSDVVRLEGARLVVATEGEEGEQLAEAFLKSITGGEEISVRGLYQKNQIEFLPKFKLMYCSNHKPRISGTDHGIWRRIRVIPFNVCIPAEKCDPMMPSKLFSEASGILNWAYEGCLRWQAEGLKDIPAAVIKALGDYRGENDVIGRFLTECVRKGSGKIYSSHLYKAYSDWSLDTGEVRKNTIQFKHYLIRNGFKEGKDKKGVFWDGISFNDVAKEADAA